MINEQFNAGQGHVGRAASDWKAKDVEAIPSSNSTLQPCTAASDEQSDAARKRWIAEARANRGNT